MRKSSRSRRLGFISLKVSAAANGAVIELLETRQLLSTTYYVAASGGSDSNPGTSQSAAWANAAKVNSTIFQPGDTILFQYGGEWHDQLLPTSDGTAANPINYGAYGNSSLARPVFEGSDYVGTSAFTSIGNSLYTFPVSAVPGGVVNDELDVGEAALGKLYCDDIAIGRDTTSLQIAPGSEDSLQQTVNALTALKITLPHEVLDVNRSVRPDRLQDLYDYLKAEQDPLPFMPLCPGLAGAKERMGKIIQIIELRLRGVTNDIRRSPVKMSSPIWLSRFGFGREC